MDAFADLLEEFPGICPDCKESGGCTEAELVGHAQDFCADWCLTSMGVTAYPNTSSVEPFDHGVWGCPEDNMYFQTPQTPGPATCQREGLLSRDLDQLQEIASDGESCGAGCWSFAMVFLVIFGTMTLLVAS